MRHQQRAALAESCFRNRYFSHFDRNARQLPQPRRLDVKCEQRRHRRFQCVAERNGQLPQRGCPAAARREKQSIASQCLPGRARRSCGVVGSVQGRHGVTPALPDKRTIDVSSKRPPGFLATLSTPQFVINFTPAWRAAPSRQSMMVCDESVTGNIRPSLSVFSFTPWAANHATVSRA